MRDDCRGMPQLERCLSNVERLVDKGDGDLAALSLDLYGETFEKQLDMRQVTRLKAVREKLSNLQSDISEDAGRRPSGMH